MHSLDKPKKLYKQKGRVELQVETEEAHHLDLGAAGLVADEGSDVFDVVKYPRND